MTDTTRDLNFDWLTVRPAELAAPSQAPVPTRSRFWPAVVRSVALLVATSMLLAELSRFFLA